jgi:hypothetical protein
MKDADISQIKSYQADFVSWEIRQRVKLCVRLSLLFQLPVILTPFYLNNRNKTGGTE